MARMPGAVWQGEHSPRREMERYDIVCTHTIVGYAPAHAAHFSVKADGTILQSRDTRYQSGANLHGNHRIIAIENEDHGSAFGSWNTRDGHAVPGFTAAQREANAKIIAWANKTHGIPIKRCANSRPGSRGVAYHRQGCNGDFSGYAYGGRVSSGEVWSTSYGKVCPGDRRIEETLEIIIPRAAQIAGGDDDMTPEQENMLKDLHTALVNGNDTQVKFPNGKYNSVRYAIQAILNDSVDWRHEQWPKPNEEGKTWRMMQFIRWSYRHAAVGRAEAEDAHRKMTAKLDKIIQLNRVQIDAYEGKDTEAILAEIDRSSKATQAAYTKALKPLQDSIAAVTELIEQHHDGTLDAEAVVNQIGERLSVPTEDPEDDGA